MDANAPPAGMAERRRQDSRFRRKIPSGFVGLSSLPRPGATSWGKWTKAEEAWDMLQFGLRLGDTAASAGDDDAAAERSS